VFQRSSRGSAMMRSRKRLIWSWSARVAYPREPLAYALFAGVLAAIGAVDTGLFAYARWSGLLNGRVTRQAGQVEVLYGVTHVLVLLASVPLAYVIGPYTAAFWLALPLMGYLFMRIQAGARIG
jgi:hypothetical protein